MAVDPEKFEGYSLSAALEKFCRPDSPPPRHLPSRAGREGSARDAGAGLLHRARGLQKSDQPRKRVRHAVNPTNFSA